MRVHVKFTQYDLLENRSSVIADGNGILSGSRLMYLEKENPSAKNEILFEEGRIVLKRMADVSSETELLEGKPGMAKVTSPYGEMYLETSLERFSCSEKVWEAVYRILSDGEPVVYQRLVWEISPSEDDLHAGKQNMD
ncbi:MAG: DUF1934 family protein [Erysipelotrichaceae bacterium]|nr:DUF1934 family protein [Erysipelotrichaceae bacterium]